MPDPSTIDFSQLGLPPWAAALLAFIVPLAIRTFMKDRAERKEKANAMLQQECRRAYNSVQNRIKREGKDEVGDKVEAGIVALDRFMVMRRGTPTTSEEKEAARAIFDALHGEFCPGGTGPEKPPQA